tara:strand:- start:154 stop:417 length:264 start_codon:yes stop_codon:yes gene_type:complete
MEEQQNFVVKIIEAMKIGQQFGENGLHKKEIALSTIKNILDEDTYTRYYPLIDHIIDALVSISKNDIKLAFKKTKKCLGNFKFGKKN